MISREGPPSGREGASDYRDIRSGGGEDLRIREQDISRDDWLGASSRYFASDIEILCEVACEVGKANNESAPRRECSETLPVCLKVFRVFVRHSLRCPLSRARLLALTMPKFAEKLRVLNRVADEILQRLAKAKRLCVYPFLQDKAIAHSIRKFPAIDSAKVHAAAAHRFASLQSYAHSTTRRDTLVASWFRGYLQAARDCSRAHRGELLDVGGRDRIHQDRNQCRQRGRRRHRDLQRTRPRSLSLPRHHSD